MPNRNQKGEVVALKESLMKETKTDLRTQFVTVKTTQSFSISQKSPTIRTRKCISSCSAIKPAQMLDKHVKDYVLGVYKQNRMESNYFTFSLLNTTHINIKDIAKKHQQYSGQQHSKQLVIAQHSNHILDASSSSNLLISSYSCSFQSDNCQL